MGESETLDFRPVGFQERVDNRRRHGRAVMCGFCLLVDVRCLMVDIDVDGLMVDSDVYGLMLE